MPSKSPKQARFIAAVSHGWKPDHVSAPPVSVAEEFNEADQKRGSFKRLKQHFTAPRLRSAPVKSGGGHQH